MTSASTSSAEVRSDELIVNVRQQELARLPTGAPPLTAETCWLHGEPPGPEQPHVLIHRAALAQINAHAESDVSTELGGVLLGRATRENGRCYVEISAAIPAVSDERGPVHFTFTADAWAQLHRDRARQAADLEIVGWFHTHPDLGVFFSADDVIVHSAAFVLPWHVALVVDPLRQQAAFFGWVGEEIVPLAGYYERLEKQATPVAWRMVQTAVWRDTGYPAYRPPADEARERPEERTVRAAGPANRRWLLPGAASLIILLLLVGLVGLNRRVRQLEQIAVALQADLLARQAAQGAAACPDSRLQLLSPAAGGNLWQGERYELLGTAGYPNAVAYQVEVRLTGWPEWQLLGATRRATTLGRLARWETALFEPGVYELRLTAVDRNGQPLPHLSAHSGEQTELAAPPPAACTIRVQLLAAAQ